MSVCWYAGTSVALHTPWPYPKQCYMVAMALCWRSMLKQSRLKVEPRTVKLAMVFMQAFHTESEHTPGSIPAFSLALRSNRLEKQGFIQLQRITSRFVFVVFTVFIIALTVILDAESFHLLLTIF